MNFPLIFRAAYCEPLAIDLTTFGALHAVLWPRIIGQSSAPLDLMAAAKTAPPMRPEKSNRNAMGASPSRQGGEPDHQR